MSVSTINEPLYKLCRLQEFGRQLCIIQLSGTPAKWPDDEYWLAEAVRSVNISLGEDGACEIDRSKEHLVGFGSAMARAVLDLVARCKLDLNLDQKDREQGWTAMHHAAFSGDAAMVALLLDAGNAMVGVYSRFRLSFRLAHARGQTASSKRRRSIVYA